MRPDFSICEKTKESIVQTDSTNVYLLVACGKFVPVEFVNFTVGFFFCQGGEFCFTDIYHFKMECGVYRLPAHNIKGTCQSSHPMFSFLLLFTHRT